MIAALPSFPLDYSKIIDERFQILSSNKFLLNSSKKPRAMNILKYFGTFSKQISIKFKRKFKDNFICISKRIFTSNNLVN